MHNGIWGIHIFMGRVSRKTIKWQYTGIKKLPLTTTTKLFVILVYVTSMGKEYHGLKDGRFITSERLTNLGTRRQKNRLLKYKRNGFKVRVRLIVYMHPWTRTLKPF